MTTRKYTSKWATVRAHRMVETQHKSELIEQRVQTGDTTHLSPYSTLIAAIGDYWAPGSLEAMQEMSKTTFAHGYEVCLYEEFDRCYRPFDALGSMRNMAYWRAIREGWEHILYVDNDVLPQPDTLIRLLSRRVPIISPIISYADGQDHDLALPQAERGRGLAMVGSCVLSFILFRTSVFLPWVTSGFWGNAIGDDEGYHFAKLELSGQRPFIDTDVEVVCQNPPHYPLDPVLERRHQVHAQRMNGLWTPPQVSRV